MASQDTLTRLVASVDANTAAVTAAVTALSELQASVTDLTAQVSDLSVQVAAFSTANATEDQVLNTLAASLEQNNTLLSANTPAVSDASPTEDNPTP